MIPADRLTVRSQEALADAVERARRAGHPQVHDTHLLQALLAQADSVCFG